MIYPEQKKQKQSALVFVLKGLIPYTRENMMLAFKPHVFFNELEKISRYKKWTLEKAYYEARRNQLITKEANVVRLTVKGRKTVAPFIAERLSSGARLMVIFDIPEESAVVRAKFRRILKQWNFDQVQKSVWITSFDRKLLIEEIINELDIGQYVKLYECSPL